MLRRFDRENRKGAIVRRHMLTAAAILEVDWRLPSLDYHTLMKLTRILSRDNEADAEQMYRRISGNTARPWTAMEKNPGTKELVAVGRAAGMAQKACQRIAGEIREKTRSLGEEYQDARS